MDNIVSQSTSATAHDIRRERPSSLNHRRVVSSPNSSTGLSSPSCNVTETSSSSSPPRMMTPPRLLTKDNPVPRAPPRKRRSSASAPPPAHSPKIDGFNITGQQQPEPEQNEIETDEVEQAVLVDSANGRTEKAALLLESSPPRHPYTPSSNTSPASGTSSRYSPTSSASRTPSTRSSSQTSPSFRYTPPTALSYEPLPPPSSSKVRQRRKLVAPPMPFLTMGSAGSVISTTDNTTSTTIHNSDTTYSDNHNSNYSESEVIMARLAANEQHQYQDQQQRLRRIFQQNLSSGKHQHREVNDASSRAISQHLQHSSNYCNMEQQHEHEIVIHPKSVEGTIESASFHLHGQTGGRVKSTNPELNNAAVIDGYALRNVMDTKNESLMSVDDDTFETNNIRIDLENGVNIISNRGGRSSSNNNNKRNLMIVDDDHHKDLWSTGIAAAVVMGTASRYHKTFCMFPHGRKVVLPIIIGILALCLSIVTLKSCRFLTVLPGDNSNQVFQLGPWSYLSPGGVYDGEVCLPYPSAMEVDTPFMVARMVSVLATCLGGGLLLLTMTMMCIPYGKPSISLLGLGYIFAGILQALTMVYYQTNNCKGSGYFGGFQCKPNQDLVFCIAASVLYLACGWILYMLQKFVVAPPGHSASEIYTCSAKSKSSDERKGILRTVEKSWTKIPSGETLVATVLVERRKGSDGKIKTIHSIQTDILTD